MSTTIHASSKKYAMVYTTLLMSTKCIQKSSTYNSFNK